MWHQPCQRCKYTTSVDIKKKRTLKLVTHVEPHASAVSLLKRAENRAILGDSGGVVNSLTFAQHRLSPLTAFSSGAVLS